MESKRALQSLACEQDSEATRNPNESMKRTPNTPQRVLIMGAAGRDFHNFNMLFRERPEFHVVAFTAAQIPDIADRRYPASLAGRLYPDGIPIVPESGLVDLIESEDVRDVYLSYSDLSHADVMHIASKVLAAGANFVLPGPDSTMLKSTHPVVSVCAVRTGVGKSAFSRHLVNWFKKHGYSPGVIRHPMPYGDLEKQATQRFADFQDLDEADTTIEEREEYEPYLKMGVAVHAGVDFARVLREAELQSDLILWDGGNNDLPFITPDLHFVMVDAHRPGQELGFHPGEANYRMADVVVINKVDSAPRSNVESILSNLRETRPGVPVILGEMRIEVASGESMKGKRVVIVGDGPTLTHGGMASGAGLLAASRHGSGEVVSGRAYAVGSLAETFARFPHLDLEIPAMGYTPEQLSDLESTLRRVPAELVVDASPVNLSRLMTIDKPIVNVEYSFRERGQNLERILEEFVERLS